MTTNMVEKLLSKMESTGILTTNEMTFFEYADGLKDFQDMAVKMVMKGNYEEGMRLDEAIFRMESSARKKGLSQDPAIRKGINALKTVDRELSISMSGIRGEQLVARTLEYINRPEAKVYKNVYLTNGIDETELDAVVVTNEGIIILEVKKTKDDLTITEDGRLIHSGDECYEKKPIGEKMRIKRQLLKDVLETAFSEVDEAIPVYVDSYIVFSTPREVRIRVNDNYHQEKWCYRTGINSRIDNYYGRIKYSDSQLNQIYKQISELESNKKRFHLSVDFDAVRYDLANAIVALELAKTADCETSKNAIRKVVEVSDYKRMDNDSREKIKKNLQKALQMQIAGCIASCILVGGITAIASGGAMFKR
ncbi:MAG: nuclease-related domain-containing protein [Anaerovoracaceae bacterium]